MSIPPAIFVTLLKDRCTGGAVAERIRQRTGMIVNGVEVVAHAIIVSVRNLD